MGRFTPHASLIIVGKRLGVSNHMKQHRRLSRIQYYSDLIRLYEAILYACYVCIYWRKVEVSDLKITEPFNNGACIVLSHFTGTHYSLHIDQPSHQQV